MIYKVAHLFSLMQCGFAHLFRQTTTTYRIPRITTDFSTKSSRSLLRRTMPPRRSDRLKKLHLSSLASKAGEKGNDNYEAMGAKRTAIKKNRKSIERKFGSSTDTARKDVAKRKETTRITSEARSCLPRSRENELKAEFSAVQYVIGVDEAGRGPLAGPVVAAAAVVPIDIVGIADSKTLTRESVREELYEKIVSSDNVRWAVAVIDSARIDEVNILQATLQGMRLAASAVAGIVSEDIADCESACVTISGCYVVTGGTPLKSEVADNAFYALLDGNRLPKKMAMRVETMVKGDSREYSIAAASILAKVTRDRLMHGYDKLYPEYNLAQHKGYPTAAHMDAVRKYGASPIHRRTFAPLKHMQFDARGRALLPKTK